MEVQDVIVFIDKNLFRKDGNLNSNITRHLYNKNPEVYNTILKHTKFLDKNVKLNQRIWHVYNNVLHPHYCKVCNEKPTNFKNFKKGYNNCCSSQCANTFKTTNIKDIQQYINKFNYTLVSTDYKNGDKLQIKCPEGHIYKSSWYNFQQGNRCPTCKRINSIKYTNEYIKDYAENKNYTVLENRFESSDDRIKLKCPEGHIYRVDFYSFIYGHECLKCKKHTYEYVKNFIINQGFILLSGQYEGWDKYLKLKCPEGHIYETNWSNFQQGKRCPVCAGKHIFVEDIESYVSEYGYTLISKQYKNCYSDIKLKCPYGHFYNSTWSRFKQGGRCPICNRYESRSKAEKQIGEYILENKLSNNVVFNDRSVINNPITNRMLELDIWLPDINKAIEFNGAYWHSLENMKIKDKIKQDQCKYLGIDLLVIKESKWQENNEEELERIKCFIKKGGCVDE